MEWQRFLRFVLVVVVAAVGVAVFRGLQRRTQPAPLLVIDRIDPDAVIQTRGSRIVQADPLGEHLQIASGRQSTYADGGMKLLDGVAVTVADREDRDGFTLTGHEATVNADQTEVRISGMVRLDSSNGLLADTETAEYTDTDGVIRMPGPTTFARDGMNAFGDRAEYDRASDLLHLLAAARVALTDGDGGTRIQARTATLAQVDGYMRFVGEVRIARGMHRMRANDVRALTVADTNQVESLMLRGDATIAGSDQRAGSLREMAARDIDLTYTEDGQGLERSRLEHRARLEVFGVTGGAGTEIHGDTVEIRFAPDGSGLGELTAEGTVRLEVPSGVDQPAQSVTSDRLSLTSTTGEELDTAVFYGAVEFREKEAATTDTDGATESERVISADRLTAGLGAGLSGLETATFVGNVVLENRDTVAFADEAVYTVISGQVELLMSRSQTAVSTRDVIAESTSTGREDDIEAGSGPVEGAIENPTVAGALEAIESRPPRLEDARRGSIQALSIVLGLNDGQVTASGEVESVLTGESDDGQAGAAVRRPGMLEANEAVYVRADALAYDDDAATTTYTGGARLWQSVTKFAGYEIVLDETVGNISASGGVETESLITQIDVETGLPKESLTLGYGDDFLFDDDAHQATYSTGARLNGPRGDLKAEEIRVFLQQDGHTLERIEADGTVDLTMTSQWVSGDTLVFHDADGRYEMTGEPVRLVERADEGCRETTGRRLTFFMTEDAVSVDGQSEVRTEAADISCPPEMDTAASVASRAVATSGV